MTTSKSRVLKCVLPGVHAVEAASARSYPRHTHDQFGIGLIRSGAQRSMSGRGMVEAGAGMVITVNPGEVHDGLPIGEAGRSWTMLYFDPETLQYVFEGFDGARGEFEFHDPVVDNGGLARRFARLYAAMTGRGESPLAAEEMALLLMEWLAPQRVRMVGVNAFGIGRARQRIDDAPEADVSLGELAALCGLSRFQFLRSFARTTGVTPHAYMLQRRVNTARRMILEGMLLADVAAASGFCDQSHMNRNFTRILGVTPGAYAAAH